MTNSAIVTVLCVFLSLSRNFNWVLGHASSKGSSSGPECSNEETEKLMWGFNSKTNLLYSYNRTAAQVAILDYNNNISTLYNGKTGAAFVSDYELDLEVYLPVGVVDATWYSHDQSFEDFFANLRPQRTLLELGKKVGVPFNSSSVTGELSEEIATILGPLSSEYASRCYALYHYKYASKATSDGMKSSLNSFAEVVGNVDTVSRGDFKWIIEMFRGLRSLFDLIDGGLGALSKTGVTLDFNTVMNAPNGFYVLIYLMENFPLSVSIEKKFRETLNSEEDFLGLVNQLGGELTYGFDGFVNVVYHIVCYVNGKGLEEDVFNILNEYLGTTTSNNGDLSQEWTSSIIDLSKTIQKLHLTNYYRNLSNLLDNIIRNTWMSKGVNLSLIVKILLQADSDDGSEAIAAVLQLIGPDRHQHPIPHLFED